MVHPEVQGIRWLGSRIKHSEVKAIHRDCVLFFFFFFNGLTYVGCWTPSVVKLDVRPEVWAHDETSRRSLFSFSKKKKESPCNRILESTQPSKREEGMSYYTPGRPNQKLFLFSLSTQDPSKKSHAGIQLNKLTSVASRSNRTVRKSLERGYRALSTIRLPLGRTGTTNSTKDTHTLLSKTQ